MCSRKFLDREGNPEEKEWVKKYTNERKRVANPDDFVHGQEVLLALRKIDDPKAIDEIFVKEIVRSRGDKGDGVRPELNRIAFEQRDSGYPSSYDGEADQIFVDPDQISEIAKKLGISIESILLWTICHEKAHAYSSGYIKGARKFDKRGSSYGLVLQKFLEFAKKKNKSDYVLTELTGYKKKTVTYDEDIGLTHENEINGFIDEGISEKIGIEVLQTYLKTHRDSIPAEDWDKIMKLDTDEEHRSPFYHSETTYLDNLIEQFAQESDLRKVVVWQAIKRGKFGQENSNDPETERLIKEIGAKV